MPVTVTIPAHHVIWTNLD